MIELQGTIGAKLSTCVSKVRPRDIKQLTPDHTSENEPRLELQYLLYSARCWLLVLPITCLHKIQKEKSPSVIRMNNWLFHFLFSNKCTWRLSPEEPLSVSCPNSSCGCVSRPSAMWSFGSKGRTGGLMTLKWRLSIVRVLREWTQAPCSTAQKLPHGRAADLWSPRNMRPCTVAYRTGYQNMATADEAVSQWSNSLLYCPRQNWYAHPHLLLVSLKAKPTIFVPFRSSGGSSKVSCCSCSRGAHWECGNNSQWEVTGVRTQVLGPWETSGQGRKCHSKDSILKWNPLPSLCAATEGRCNCYDFYPSGNIVYIYL